MEELIKLLDKNLRLTAWEVNGDTIYIKAVSVKEEAVCPFCGQVSNKIHSTYIRTLQDLPIQGKKVILILLNKKYFCNNSKCRHKTFSERFSFFSDKAKMTKRLQEEIINLSINCSSVTASHLLRKNVAKVSKSTICNILKKRRTITHK